MKLIRNKTYNIILISAFLIILTLPTIDNIFKFSDNLSFKLNENRKLKTLPKLTKDNGKFKKKYPKEFEAYYDDNFGFRNLTIFLGKKLLTQATRNSDSRFLKGTDGWLFLNEKNMSKDIKRTISIKDKEINIAVEKLYNNWVSLKEQGIKYVFILVPNKQTIYPEYLPKYLYHSYNRKKDTIQDRTTKIINTLLNKYPNFPILDLRKPLKQAKDNEDRILYHKNDSHWNAVGMQYAYKEIYQYLKNNQKTNLNFSKFDISKTENKSGDLSKMALSDKLDKTFIAKVKNKQFTKSENSETVTAIQDIIKNKYKSSENIDRVTLFKHNKSYSNNKTFIQHDSFFEDLFMQPFLANSFAKESLFVRNIFDHNLLCTAQHQNIKEYKPKLVIHQMVERYFVKYCPKSELDF